MDNLIQKLKSLRKDEFSEDQIKEQQVRKTLAKLDPDTMMDVDEMATKLQELSPSRSKTAPAQSSASNTKAVVDAAKTALQRLSRSDEDTAKIEDPHPFFKEDNLFNLYDDFR